MTQDKNQDEWIIPFKQSDYEFPSNNFVRFYTQEDVFHFKYQPHKIPTQVNMFINKIINNTITDLLNMNNLIAINTRVSVNFIQNGREIAFTKEKNWEDMLNQQIFITIKKAYQLLDLPSQQILKYTILAVSNLILKLGINMSKICMLLFQKKLTFNCLSVCALAASFLIYVEYNMYQTKKEKSETESSLFWRHLPKMSIIKLSYRKNSYEGDILNKCQNKFIQSKNKTRNLQFIQLYEEGDGHENNEQDFEYITSINIKKLNIKSPFSFELLYFFKHYIFHLVNDFKPDIIIFVESYPENKIVIDAELRGLILTQIIQNITPKIYYMKEYGCEQFVYPKLCEIFKEKGGPGRWHDSITQETSSIFKKVETEFNADYVTKKAQCFNYMHSMRKIMLNDLAYCSLALLQKGKFEKLIQKSHRYIYNCSFIEEMAKLTNRKLELIKKQSKQDRKPLINHLCQQQKKGLNMIKMLTSPNLKNRILQMMNKTTTYHKIYNIKSDRMEQLITEKGQIIYYNNSDQLLVEYKEDRIYVFIFGEKSYIFLRKIQPNQTFEVMVNQVWEKEQMMLKGCAIVCSDNYIYRAFGMSVNDQSSYKHQIYRFRFTQSGKGEKWNVFSEIINEDKQIKKHSAYGFYASDYKRIFLMGGYIDSINQEKIEKKVYVIEKDTEGITTSKSSMKSLSLQNLKPTLYPFIFGMPFYQRKEFGQIPRAMILNTNSDYNHLNNAGKIFLSQYQIEEKLHQCGLKPQYKLLVKPEQKINILINKVNMIDYIVMGSYHINRYFDRVAVRVPGEGTYLLTMNFDKHSVTCSPKERQNTSSSGDFELSFQGKKM